MSKTTTRSSAARRNAEALLGRAQKREASFKLDQEREYEAMALKTARLRELRLAKEAADKAAEVSTPPVSRPAKPRRSRQT
ncbi:MAG: hypothetical protein R6X03_07495 [Methyloceanibacter sp.]|jgi:hypothetical protein